jgi:ribosomal protein L37E
MLNTAVQIVCKRCGRAMRNVAEIAPINGHPGLLAFACAACGTTQSILLYSGDAVSGAARPNGFDQADGHSIL